MKNIIARSVLLGFVCVAQTALAGPLVDVNKIAEVAGDTAVSITNSVTGGVTSKEGKVTAKGKVTGNATNMATGEGSKATVNVGSNKGVTAKGDISAEGTVTGNLTNSASGKNSEAQMSIGGNGQ